METDEYSRWFELLLLNNTASTFTITIVVIAVVVLLIFSALISGSEVAYFSLSQRVTQQLEKSTNVADKRVFKLISEPGMLLATILIANNLINIGIIILSSFALDQVISINTVSPNVKFVIEVIVVTFCLVLFGEVSPKIYANLNNLKLSRLMSRPMLVLRIVFFPLSKLLMTSTSFIEKRLSKATRQDNSVSIEDIEQAIELTVQGEESTKQEKDMLRGIVQFGNVSAKQIMTPRVNVTAIDIEQSFDELLEIAMESNYSRIPVYEDNLDNIEGIIYVKDLLLHLRKPEETFRWQDLIRTPYYVPEAQRIDSLLEKLKKDRMHIAIVVDEYGGTAGIVTMEDILEEVIGDIQDEFDDEESEITYEKLGDNLYRFEGQTLIIDVCRILDIDTNAFDNARGDADSLAGMILELKMGFPEEGEELEIEEYLFKVVAASQTRIESVEVSKVELPENQDS